MGEFSKPTLLNRLRGLFSKRKKVSLTQKYIVEITDSALSVTDPDENTRSIALNKIISIITETNDSGPWGEDVWFIIAGAGADEICVYPLGAENEDAALAYFSTLPGFTLKGMNSTANQQFVCWTKSGDD